MPDITHQDKHTATPPQAYYCGTPVSTDNYRHNADGCYLCDITFASGTKITVPVSVLEVK